MANQRDGEKCPHPQKKNTKNFTPLWLRLKAEVYVTQGGLNEYLVKPGWAKTEPDAAGSWAAGPAALQALRGLVVEHGVAAVAAQPVQLQVAHTGKGGLQPPATTTVLLIHHTVCGEELNS